MKFETSAAISVLLGVASARPDAVRSGSAVVARQPHRAGMLTKFRREVPQEHSHEPILVAVNTALKLDNPKNIQDAVFSLLGNAAAAEGAGDVTNLDCLQQEVADQAFTNAKAAGDVTAQANALLFRALERNTGKVGLASVICNETAVNPEVAAISQHQDPASANAAATNKQIVLDLAAQLASIGADPQLALSTGTFPPGDVNDNTGKGKSCDDIVDVGCIVQQNLLVEDATAAEIDAAVAAAGGAKAGNGNANAGNGTANAGDAACDAAAGDAANNAAPAGKAKGKAGKASAGKDNAAGANGGASAAGKQAANGGATATAGVDVNAFTGSVGSAPVPVVSSASDRPFSVNGDTFINLGAAVQRACDVQKNACANAANSGGSGSVADCDAQAQACRTANAKKRRAALDTGSCGSPAIEFADGLDGRKEASFAPVNSADFNHGSALKPAVITSFICQQLESKCKAAQATVDACQEGATAANAATGQNAADAFNAALGV
ncbi:uncharacterized protein JN550_000924 [Neoarthrinium moseri]|uniref:uncharacterized protein n=1 Tax=Neoarthrinium moseri TaxID=1658444 RepID=UPI001FDBA87E|nr:uncharacterized protein JN550_000924 [Neoarthrinium moseri]KAI1876852.1 hypothetical protein JN550_000924 [Neoarthrinium moseri]